MSESLCIIKEGWLTKQGGVFKTWHKRWFTLIGKELTYSKEKSSPEKGKIKITNIIHIEKAPESKKPYSFKIIIPEIRTYYICAETENEMISWMEKLERIKLGDNISDTFSIDEFKILKVLFTNEFKTIQLLSKINEENIKYIEKIYLKKYFEDENYLNLEIEHRTQCIINELHFITPLRSIISNENSIHFIFDFIPNGCLFSQLYYYGKFSENQAKLYIAEIILGIEELHHKNIYYYDLKNSNILLDSRGHIRITSPGISITNFELNLNEYSPPELFEKKEKTISCDYYGIGILLYEMICGMPPFFDLNFEKLKNLILNSPIRFPFHISNLAKSLILKLMDKNPLNRLGMNENGIEDIKKDPFFNNLNWNDVYFKKIDPKPFEINQVFMTIEEFL